MWRHSAAWRLWLHATPSCPLELLEQALEKPAETVLLWRLRRWLTRRTALLRLPRHSARRLLLAEHAHVGIAGRSLRLRIHVALIDFLRLAPAALVGTDRIARNEPAD